MTVCGIKQADGVCVGGECPYFKKCCSAVWDKSGEPQTNEEWFCSLSTEEKADLMSRMVGCSNCPIPKDGRSCMGTYSGCWHEIIKWLKQPHTKE